MKKAAYAIHLITGAKDTHVPGSVFEVDADEFDRLRDKGAVRKPTDEEMALFEMSKPKDKGAKGDNDESKSNTQPTGTDSDTEAKIAAAKSEEDEKVELHKVLKDAGKKVHPNTGIDKLRAAVAELESDPSNLDLTGE